MKKKKQDNLFIIHFQPLEFYPPVINLLDYLAKNAKEKIIVTSTKKNDASGLKEYSNSAPDILIFRAGIIRANSFFRLFDYLFFYLKCFFLLCKYKPVSVLYFETLSSWPALMYKKLKGKKLKLFVHYHEYTTPDEYEHTMQLIKWMHRTEVKMYETSFKWISHTNEVRLEKFKLDHSLQKVNGNLFHQMPNYPSKFWAIEKNKFGESKKTRLVYVGALGFDNMYLQEIIDWVLLNKEFLSLDFYAYNIDRKAKDFLDSIKDDCIRYHGGCNYEDLPGVLKNYDVGMVLYKPYSYNQVNGASNKIFEYLACGLDVWFSKEMTYTLSFVREDVYPKIIALDFKNLNGFDFRKASDKRRLQYHPSDYYYENVYQELYNKMTG